MLQVFKHFSAFFKLGCWARKYRKAPLIHGIFARFILNWDHMKKIPAEVV
jgi:hypothetical protein